MQYDIPPLQLQSRSDDSQHNMILALSSLLALLATSASLTPRDPYTWLNRFNLPPAARGQKSLRGPSVFQANYQKTGFHRHEKIKPFQFNFKKGVRMFHQSLPGKASSQSEVRQSERGGCDTPGGFRRGGETWQMEGCRRGTCAITLSGGWQTQEDKCDGLIQNPQYQCVMEEDLRFPFPDCCARSVQCRDLGPLPQ